MSLISEIVATVGSFQQIQGVGSGGAKSVLFVPEGLGANAVITSEVAVGSYLTAAEVKAQIKLLSILKSKYGQNVMNSVLSKMTRADVAKMMQASPLTASMSSDEATAYLDQMYTYLDNGNIWQASESMTDLISDYVLQQSQKIEVGFAADSKSVAFFGSKGITQPLKVTATLDGVTKALKSVGIVYDFKNVKATPPSSLTESVNYFVDVYVGYVTEAIREVETIIGENGDVDIILNLLNQVFYNANQAAYRNVVIGMPVLRQSNFLQTVAADTTVATNLVAGGDNYFPEYMNSEATALSASSKDVRTWVLNVGMVDDLISIPLRLKKESDVVKQPRYYVSFFDSYGVDFQDSVDIADSLDGKLDTFAATKVLATTDGEEKVEEEGEVVTVTTLSKIDALIRYLGRMGLLLTDDAWEDSWAASLIKL